MAMTRAELEKKHKELAAELAKLDDQIKKQKSADAAATHKSVVETLTANVEFFTDEQRLELLNLVFPQEPAVATKFMVSKLTADDATFSDDDKTSIRNAVKGKPGRSKGKKTGTTKPRTQHEPNAYLMDGKKTPFYKGAQGRAPKLLTEFEATEQGAKLKADGKPTFQMMDAK
ncbi:hypothetical protein [Pseudoxanthomonas winnipegensis]|uniref:Uncharacterized protein n=1 Tax=Pseudoxanthomonas winnipegensis TaxID=2480810 RepID=A0A4Q8M2Y4_9GAMM|nr:hypothetical protein [Pseudoxanthomonas winnipegensis]TAA41567.1 hypothetical protein EA655_11535 [Pseudoxanthomonas winnipegensis]